MQRERHEAERVLRRPAAWVARTLANADLTAAWQWRLVGSRQVSPGPPAPGARAQTWAWTGLRGLGWRRYTDWTLVALTPDRAVTWRAASWWGEEERAYEVLDHPDGACVRVVATRARRLPWGPPLAVALEQDLDGLVQMMERGLVEREEDDARGTPGDVRWLVDFDLRATPVSDDVVHLELDRRHAPCTMYCTFCPRTATYGLVRDLPPPTPEDIARVMDTARRIAAVWPDSAFVLWSDDLLRFPALDALLDALGPRRLSMHTPGVALADPAVADVIARHHVHVDLTVHATDPDVWEAMCGNRDALPLVLRGLDHLAERGVPFDLSVVVTHRNVGHLARTLIDLTRRYRPARLSIRLFYPDAKELGRGYLDQFPAYAAVVEQLRQAAAEVPELPRLQMANLPLCQVPSGALAGLPVWWTVNRNSVRTYSLPACEGCPAREVCPGVHRRYAAAFPVAPVDPEEVRRVLDLGRDGGAPDGVQGVQLPLDDDGLAWLFVADHDPARPAWLHGDGTDARYRLDGRLPADRRAALERALNEIGDALRRRGVRPGRQPPWEEVAAAVRSRAQKR